MPSVSKRSTFSASVRPAVRSGGNPARYRNLRSRVRSYFAGDKRRRIDNMLRDLHTIDHTKTSSEIEAAVLAARGRTDEYVLAQGDQIV